ncbi:MAG: hypothetical protein R6U84_03430 [Candidatus Cloacimonadales bacterium]
MRKIGLIAAILLLVAAIFAVEIPYSEVETKSADNLLGQMLKVSPEDGEPVPQQTDVYLWYDHEFLYVLFEAELNDDFEVGTYASGESFPEADFLRLQLITNPQSYYAYCFYAFPLENRYDAVRNSDMNMDGSWDSDYSYENEITEDRWRCLMKIPFKDLRYTNDELKQWKVISSRRFYAEDEYYSFPYTTTNMGKDYFRKAFDISLSAEITKLSNRKIRPYYVQKYDLKNDEYSALQDNLGLDLSYNPTTSTKLKIALNPDFSDVPMDSEGDNFNLRYAPWFEENRFFFTEDIDVFGVDDDLFYSRNLMQPIYAVKLTGNGEKYAFGLLSAQDKEVKSAGNITNDDDYYNLAAYKLIYEKYSLQTTFLNTFNTGFHNEVLHLRAAYELNNANEIYLGSDLSYYKAEAQQARKGYELYAAYRFRKDDFRLSTTLISRSKDLISQMGRMFDTDYTSGNLNLNYSYKPIGASFLEEAGISGWSAYSHKTESDAFNSTNIGTNLWFNFSFDLNYWLNLNSGKYLYVDDYHDFSREFAWNDYSTGFSYHKFSNLGFSASFSQKLDFYYSRLRNYQKRKYGLNVWGNYGSRLNYGFDLNRIEYLDFAREYAAELISDAGETLTITDSSDDNYNVGNAYVTLNLSNSFSIKNGLGFNSYEFEDRTGHLGFYANLKWEFRQDYFLYAGYSTAVDEIERSGFWDESRILNHEQIYLKIVITI